MLCACILHAMMTRVTTPLQIRNMPDEALEALRERAAKRQLSLAAYAREVLVRGGRPRHDGGDVGSPAGDRRSSSDGSSAQTVDPSRSPIDARHRRWRLGPGAI